MDEMGAACAALAEGTVFLSYFKEMPDHRQQGKVIYPLDEILLLCLLAVLAGAEGFTDIAQFGEKKLDLLRRFRPYKAGTPALINNRRMSRCPRSCRELACRQSNVAGEQARARPRSPDRV